MRYAVSIDEVVLHGFGPVDRQRVSTGLREELHRLLSRDGLPAGLTGNDELDAGRVDLVPGDDRATGRSIARGVYGRLSR
jgi:hypothetical protein